jgi:hypothetical protein
MVSTAISLIIMFLTYALVGFMAVPNSSVVRYTFNDSNTTHVNNSYVINLSAPGGIYQVDAWFQPTTNFSVAGYGFNDTDNDTANISFGPSPEREPFVPQLNKSLSLQLTPVGPQQKEEIFADAFYYSQGYHADFDTFMGYTLLFVVVTYFLSKIFLSLNKDDERKAQFSSKYADTALSHR